MAGDTPKDDEPTKEEPIKEEPKDDQRQTAADPPEIFLAAAGGGLIGGAIGAALTNLLSGS